MLKHLSILFVLNGNRFPDQEWNRINLGLSGTWNYVMGEGGNLENFLYSCSPLVQSHGSCNIHALNINLQ